MVCVISNDARMGRPLSPPVELRGSRARKTGPWILDLGGIAKGYAVDRAVEKIRRLAAGRGVSGVVNAGGDLRAWGPDPTPVALQASGPASGYARLELRNAAVASSSVRIPGLSCERLTAAGHVRMPENRLLRRPATASIFARRCLWADALTKVAMLGPPAIARRCLEHYGARAIVWARLQTPHDDAHC